MGDALNAIASSLAREWRAVDFQSLQYWRRDTAEL